MMLGSEKRPMDRTTLEVRYRGLRDQGLEATRLGRFLEAKIAFSQAAEVAAELGEPYRDRAFCNLSSIDIELGADLEAIIPRLRQILVKGADLESTRLAAYHLARAYELRADYKKALFYARVARERSERTGLRAWLGSSHNQMGQLLIAESSFAEARAELEAAMELMPRDDENVVGLASVKVNLGYCFFVQKEPLRAFPLLFDALRTLRRVGARGLQSLAHETLCFGYLESNRLRPAVRHGLRALQLAEQEGEQQTVKNALFLLGEAANVAGDSDEARAYFTRLQKQHFPEHDFLADFLLAVDVRDLVNLRA